MNWSFPSLDDSQKQVLRLIRKLEAVSGAELARYTSLQPSTMVYILRKLNKQNLIEQAGTGTSTGKGGKRPTLWKVKNNQFFILGLEILPTKYRFVITDLNGKIVQQQSVKLPSGIVKKPLAKAVSAVIKEIISEYQKPADQLMGAGIAVPGLVDFIMGSVLYSSSLQVTNLDLLNEVQPEFDFPLFVANDANAAALTVPWYGEYDEIQSPQDFVYLLYTQGAENLGSGLFINGALFQGNYGTAGEIFTPLPKLKTWYEEALRKNLKPLNPIPGKAEIIEIADLVEDATNGCQLSDFVLRSLMSFIGDEIIRIVGFLNPEEIILGGDLVNPAWLIEGYLSPFLKEKAIQLQSLGYQLPALRYSPYGKYSVSLGATALVLNEFM